MAVPEARRPWDTPLNLFYVVVAVAGLWYMRVVPVLEDAVDLDPHVRSGELKGVRLRTEWTGVAGLDYALNILIFAFIAGPAGWDQRVRLQQIHFLVNFSAVVCIWAVESCRRRNAGRLLTWTAMFAFLYQTIGAAIFVPLYCWAYNHASARDAYFSSGRAVPLSYARALLPACMLGWTVPTVALYIDWGNLETTQKLLAFWQVAPQALELMLLGFAGIAYMFEGAGVGQQRAGKNADVPYLKLIYVVAGAVSALAHVYALGQIFTSMDPEVTVASVLLPSWARLKLDVLEGLIWIFQWDEVLLFLASLVWCWHAVWDVRRLQLGGSTASVGTPQVLGAGLLIALATVLAGPGTAMAAVWYWREDRLVMIEERAEGTSEKKTT